MSYAEAPAELYEAAIELADAFKLPHHSKFRERRDGVLVWPPRRLKYNPVELKIEAALHVRQATVPDFTALPLRIIPIGAGNYRFAIGKHIDARPCPSRSFAWAVLIHSILRGPLFLTHESEFKK